MGEARGPAGQFTRLAIIFFILAAGIGVAGFVIYSSQRDKLRQAEIDELVAVAESKRTQIETWRREREGDAHVIAENALATRYIQLWLRRKSSRSLRDDLTDWMLAFVRTYEYRDVVLLDGAGKEALTATGTSRSIEPETEAFIRRSARMRRILFTDIHESGPSRTLQLEVVVPLYRSGDRNASSGQIGTMLLLIDPSTFLFPFVQSWPTPSKSSETLIVRRDSNQVVFLTRLLRGQERVSALRMPVSAPDLPAAMAVQGKEGVVEGVDYSGVPVFAVLRKVVGSPWYLVTKVDQEEVFADVRHRIGYIGLFTLLLIGLAAVAFVAEWRRQRARHLLSLYEAELEAKALSEHYGSLTKYANDIIVLADSGGRILDANDRALSAYQYSRGEITSLSLSDLQRGGSGARPGAGDSRTTSGGSMFEAINRRRDGTTFPVEVSERIIRIEEREFIQRIIRDITERKRDEQLLRASESRYRQLFDHNPHPMWVYDRETLAFLAVNNAAVRHYGFTREEFMGMTLLDIRPEDQRPALLASVRGEREILREVGVVRHCMKGGGLIEVDITTHDIDYGGRQARLVLAIDVTEKIKAESALRALREKLQAFYQAGVVGTLFGDVHGNITEANDEFLRMVGYQRRDLEEGNLRWVDITPPEFLPLDEEGINEAKRRGSCTPYEKQYIRKDGTRVWVLVGYVLVGERREDSVAFILDISKSKEAEEALRGSEERYRLLFDETMNGFALHEIITDQDGSPVDYRFLEVNPAYERMTGLSASATVGKTAREVFPSLEVEWVRIYAEVALTGTPMRFEQEAGLLGRHFEIAAFSPHPGQFATFLSDITDRKKAEAEILNSLREKEILLREIHHRVKNNLQVVSSLLNLQSDEIKDAGVRELFRESQRRVRSMGLVHEKLYRSGSLAAVDFGDYARSVTEELARAFNRDGVSCRVEAENVQLGVDTAIPCGLILSELVSNALKHGFAGREKGCVLVKLRPAAGRTIELSVQDNGVGFPELLDFRTVTSMGMNLVTSLVDQISGTIRLDRSGGTTFTIEFPV